MYIQKMIKDILCGSRQLFNALILSNLYRSPDRRCSHSLPAVVVWFLRRRGLQWQRTWRCGDPVCSWRRLVRYVSAMIIPSEVSSTFPPMAVSSSTRMPRRLDSFTFSSSALRITVVPFALAANTAITGISSIRAGISFRLPFREKGVANQKIGDGSPPAGRPIRSRRLLP